MLFPIMSNGVGMARILIAEDEPDIRELMVTLRFAGHEVIATSNGEEALNQASEVILTSSSWMCVCRA